MNRKLKILQVINSLGAGGAETFVTQLSITLKKEGHDVNLFTYAGIIDEIGNFLDAKLQKEGIVHHSLNYKKKLMKGFVPLKLWQIIANYKPDIVHVHLPQSEIFTFIAGKFTKTKTIFIRTIHNIKQTFKPALRLEKILRNFYQYNVACSDAVFHSGDLNLPKDKTVIIYNGIDLTQIIKLDISKNLFRKKLKLPEDKFIFINIGSMNLRGGTLQKAQDIILKAFTKICKKDKSMYLILIGDGNYKNKLIQLANQLDIQENVLFAGNIINPIYYLAASNVFVMPSYFEGLPISVIEAVSVGLPLVISDIPSFRVFDAPSTIKCRPGDIEDLAQALNIIRERYDEFQYLAGVQREKYFKLFNIESVAKEYIRLYYKLLAIYQYKRLSQNCTF